VEWVAEPDAETGVILGENVRYIIISDELLFMELCEYPFSEGFLDWFEVYLPESAENTIFPIPVSKKSVKVRMIVECLAGCLYGEDSGEFTLVNAECLRQCAPSGTEEDGVQLTVVLNTSPVPLQRKWSLSSHQATAQSSRKRGVHR